MLIGKERCVCAFLNAFSMTQPAISNHLRVLREAGLVASGSEAQRNVEQGGVRINGERVDDKGLQLEPGSYVLQVGKRKFARVTLTG